MAIDHPDPTLIRVTHIKNHFQIRLLTTVSFSLNLSQTSGWEGWRAYYQDCLFGTFKEGLSVPTVLYLGEQVSLGCGAKSLSLHSTDKLTLQLLIWDVLMVNSHVLYVCMHVQSSVKSKKLQIGYMQDFLQNCIKSQIFGW